MHSIDLTHRSDKKKLQTYSLTEDPNQIRYEDNIDYSYFHDIIDEENPVVIDLSYDNLSSKNESKEIIVNKDL